MSDHVPIAAKVDAEVTALAKLWRTRRWLAILVVLVTLSLVAWSVYSNWSLASRLDDLRAENDGLSTRLRDSERENRGLREVVAPLIARAAREFPGEEINDSLKKVVAQLEASLPQNQLIASAAITVEVFCESEAKLGNHFMDQGCIAALAKGKDALLASYSIDSFGHTIRERTARYRAVTQMQADDSAVGRKLATLCDAEYLQIEFAAMPEDASVIEGKAMLVFNGSLRCELQIPPQKAKGRRIFVRDVANTLIGSIYGGEKNTAQPDARPNAVNAPRDSGNE